MAGAIQPRINKAIIDTLTADESLLDLVRSLPGSAALEALPLYWYRAPASAPRPYVMYGPTVQDTDTEPLRCGDAGLSEDIYEVLLITDGVSPGGGIAIVDRIADLLDGLTTTVEGVKVSFLRVGGRCIPDYTTLETAVTHNGLKYRAQVR